MSVQLLNCTICPKLPVFSDTSHLLTHVGSKGHLSHLHKLQVRSHQELDAGVQLAAYNQWYQDHGLGQLLSERMLLKEAKQANKKTNTARAAAPAAKQGSASLNRQFRASPGSSRIRSSTRARRTTARAKRARKEESTDSDLDFTPVKRPRRKYQRAKLASPSKRSLRLDLLLSSEVDCPAEADPDCLATPEHAKLKGTVWPGMNLFDAATSEMKRKRNQKKDGSVLRKMERLASMVQPLEAVYSPSGELKKERHIDDLESESGLIEGETPIPKSKQTRPRKRQPLVERDSNAPRLVKRRVKIEESRSTRDRGMNDLPSLPYLPSSSTIESYNLEPRFVLSDIDELDFKPHVPFINARRHPPAFKIFNDVSPTYSAIVPSVGTRPSKQTDAQALLASTEPGLASANMSWHQPLRQPILQYPNPYTSHQDIHRDYPGQYDSGQDKENVSPTELPLQTANPLSWRSPFRESHEINIASELPFETFFGLFPRPSHHDDPFVASRNPFAEALPHLNGLDSVAIKADSESAARALADQQLH